MDREWRGKACCAGVATHLPLHYAKRALDRDLAVEMGSQSRFIRSWRPADPAKWIDLDTGEVEQAQGTGIVHAAFDPEERIEHIGVASVMRVAA